MNEPRHLTVDESETIADAVAAEVQACLETWAQRHPEWSGAHVCVACVAQAVTVSLVDAIVVQGAIAQFGPVKVADIVALLVTGLAKASLRAKTDGAAVPGVY